ncbi:MAG: hypothetical protein AAF502_17070 [Bacteroidota bacterium]
MIAITKKVTLPVYIMLLLAMLITSCNKESISLTPAQDDPPTVSLLYPGVAEALWPYFHKFEEEGTLRGLEIDLTASGITGVIEAIDEDGVAGQCTYYSHQSNAISVDQEFWNISSPLWKEFIVFHELGHCFLDRGHTEDAFSNGVCTSLMRSGLGDCFDNYSDDTRSYYLDELFSTGLPLP